MLSAYTITSLLTNPNSTGLALLADCTAAVKQRYLVNRLLLNGDKSETICLGM